MIGGRGGGVCWRNTDLGVIWPSFKTQLLLTHRDADEPFNLCELWFSNL